MQRALNIGERVMYVDGQTPVNATFGVKIGGPLTLPLLCNALAGLQARHPLLRAAVAPNDKGIPCFITPAAIPAIPVQVLERQDDDHWMEACRNAWAQPFDVRNGPLARLIWLRGEGVSDLILVCHHCICDGSSFVTLMRELLLLLDEPDRNIGAYPDLGAIESFIPSQMLARKAKVLKTRIVAGLARGLFSLKKDKGVPPKGNDYMLHWKLDQDTTAALLSRCKAEQVSPHAALCVAFLCAFRAVKGVKAHNRLTCPADIRRFIPQIGQDQLFAFAPTVNLSLKNGAGIGFWQQAALLKDDLAAKIARLDVFELLLFSKYFYPAIPRLVRFLLTTDGNHDFTFSNMGRLDIPERFGQFTINTVYSPTVAFPWRNPNTIITTTYRGCMDFTLLSNDAFLPYAEAEAIRDKAILQLRQEAVLSPVAQL